MNSLKKDIEYGSFYNMSYVVHLYKKYVKGTSKKAIVQLVEVHLCHLTVSVMKGLSLTCNRVYLNTRVLKHLYDKRPAEEFDLMTETLLDVVKYPNKIYKNKDGKRGSLCFVKEIKNSKCFVSLEPMCDEKKVATHYEVATFFRTDDDYLKNYELLWEWKGGTPSS